MSRSHDDSDMDVLYASLVVIGHCVTLRRMFAAAAGAAVKKASLPLASTLSVIASATGVCKGRVLGKTVAPAPGGVSVYDVNYGEDAKRVRSR